MSTTDEQRTHELLTVVNRSISSIFIEEVHGGDTCAVILREDEDNPAYFDTGDKRNKILAIEAVRWFRDLPWMTYLVLTIPGMETIGIRREDVERLTNGRLESAASDRRAWLFFIERYDNPVSRSGLALDLRRIHARRAQVDSDKATEDQ